MAFNMQKNPHKASKYFLSIIPHLTSLSSHSIPRRFSMASTTISSNQKHKETFVPDEDNALQKHVFFFDMNKDGIVYPWETFQGFRAIGCGFMLSVAAAAFINMGLSRKTRPGKYPSLLFPIEVKNVKSAKHGSDSGVYDSNGRFVPEKFEEIFVKHARTHPNALTSDEVGELLRANRESKDYAGWLGAYTEWKILYALCKDRHGLLHKHTVRAVYDGSLFHQMAKEHQSSKQKA